MQKESLNKAITIILESIENLEINEFDKIELLLNLYQFLNNYEENIRWLNEKKTRKH